MTPTDLVVLFILALLSLYIGEALYLLLRFAHDKAKKHLR